MKHNIPNHETGANSNERDSQKHVHETTDL